MCVDCARKAQGFWTCSVCKAKKPKKAFQTWMSQHVSRRGDQVCDSCSGQQLARGIVRKAVQRVAATRAKVAEQKRARVIASVWEEIAERKRKRQETGTEREATPKQNRQKDKAQVPTEGRAQTITPLQACRDAKTPEQLGAAGQARKKLFEYTCPFCGDAVSSNVRTGQVDHRRSCGNQFSVRDGHMVAKSYVYVCPFCNGNVLSNTRTGRINHRTVCNNQFYVKDGHVSKTTRQYPHSSPVCHRIVWSSRAYV